MSRNRSIDQVQAGGAGAAARPGAMLSQRIRPRPFQSLRSFALPGKWTMYFHRRFVREVGLRMDPERLSLLILLAALLMLLLAAAPGAQAQGRCRIYNSGWYFRMSGGYIKGDLPLYDNSSCTPPSYGGSSAGKYGMVDDWDREAAIRSCIKHTGIKNMRVSPHGALFWSCKPIKDSDGDSGSGFGALGSANYRRREIQTSKLRLGSVKVSAELGLNSGIIFERYDHYAVGVQSVVDRGILDVVNVWGQASQNYEVCFPQAGAIVFVDAATSPRKVIDLDSYARDGFTCGAMNRAGQFVLVKGSTPSSSNDALARAFIDATNDDASSAIDLENCNVSSTHNLNLRDDPWGEKITVVPKHTSVPASARTESWYRVRFTEAAEEADDAENSAETFEGWISAWLSEGDGDCDWRSDDADSPALASSEITPPEEELSIASIVRELGL